MRHRPGRILPVLVGLLVSAGVACGARTGLWLPPDIHEEPDAAALDADVAPDASDLCPPQTLSEAGAVAMFGVPAQLALGTEHTCVRSGTEVWCLGQRPQRGTRRWTDPSARAARPGPWAASNGRRSCERVLRRLRGRAWGSHLRPFVRWDGRVTVVPSGKTMVTSSACRLFTAQILDKLARQPRPGPSKWDCETVQASLIREVRH